MDWKSSDGKTYALVAGAAVARRLKGFGCKILYSGRSPKPDVAGPLEAEYVPLNELLARSDFVIPLTPLSDVWVPYYFKYTSFNQLITARHTGYTRIDK